MTDQLVPGETAELVVAADNRVNHSTLPVGNEGSTAFFGSDNPGVPSVEAAKVWRKPQNLPGFDFFNYAGINRPGSASIRRRRLMLRTLRWCRILTAIPGGKYEIKTAGSGEDEVRIRILDADGNEVAAADGAGGTVRIPNARLWWPWPGSRTSMRRVCHLRGGSLRGDIRHPHGGGRGNAVFDQWKTVSILRALENTRMRLSVEEDSMCAWMSRISI